MVHRIYLQVVGLGAGAGGEWGGMGGDLSLYNLSALLYFLFYRKPLFLLVFKGQLKVLEQKPVLI